MTVEDQVFGATIPGRSCGDCVACCKLTSINVEELRKPANVLCPHCTGAGCGIYDRRPAGCASFFCAWRRMVSMPDEARPDRLGAMFMLAMEDEPPNILRKVYIRGMALNSWDDFNKPLAVASLQMFMSSQIPVWLHYDGVVRLLHPNDAVAAVVINGSAPLNKDVAREAARWTAIYGAL